MVLNSAGTLLAKKRHVSKVDEAGEAEILVQAVRVNTLSKLTHADAVRFDQLVGDLFPTTPLSDIADAELVNCIEQAYSELGLVHMERQVKKMLEFYQQIRQTTGVVIVGPSGSGKSTLWKVLKLALSKMTGNAVKHYAVNPKSMPRERLLGHIDMDTREWYDGVITNASRAILDEPLDVQSWVICDGDVDPEWIESLNSVLDDNR